VPSPVGSPAELHAADSATTRSAASSLTRPGYGPLRPVGAGNW
jgi:hypothetical protein